MQAVLSLDRRRLPHQHTGPFRQQPSTAACERTAVWVPSWYSLDQPLEVGKERLYDFSSTPPSYVAEAGRLVFFHELMTADRRAELVQMWAKVTGIENATLGRIRSIGIGLDYEIVLLDGSVLLVNAEEEPGLVHYNRGGRWVRAEQPVEDWRVLVSLEMEPASRSPLEGDHDVGERVG